MLNFLAVFLFFSLIIIIHELGHFWAARRFGVEVLSFQIGFGPELIAQTRKRTRFSWNLIPLGGMVQLAGLDDFARKKSSVGRRYTDKNWWQRFLIILAGPCLNLLLGLLVFILIYSVFGLPQGVSSRIATVLKNTPAANSGIQRGDELLAVDYSSGKPEDLVRRIHAVPRGQRIAVTIRRLGQQHVFQIVPAYNEKSKISQIGIILQPEKQIRLSLPRAIGQGCLDGWNFLILFSRGLKQLFGNFQMAEVSGPVGILAASNEIFQYGWIAFLNFFAILSLNIGLINLLPLPALDGGRIMFLLIELIFRRKVNQQLEKYVHFLGFVLLIGLLLLVSISDLRKLLP